MNERLVGKYTKLTVLNFYKGDDKLWYCNCICECGNTKNILWKSIRLGKTKSCGCITLNNKFNYKHGNSKTKLYSVWKRILSSCLNEKNPYFYNYGGRGITVCDEWLNINIFFEWAINNEYKEGLEIDRIDNDGNYEPSNCRFVTRQENSGVGRRRIINKGKTGFVGVRAMYKNVKYQAYIKLNQKYIIIGTFDHIEEALKARIDFEIKTFGEQRTNK